MKPVNFIKIKKKRNNFNIRLSLFLPLILVVTFIFVDYMNISRAINGKEENSIEEAEVLNLEMEIKDLKQISDDLIIKEDFLESLDSCNSSSEDLINIINCTKEFEDENTFITSIYYDKSIRINGNSLEEESIERLMGSLNEICDIFHLEEIKYNNGYYSFNICEVSK